MIKYFISRRRFLKLVGLASAGLLMEPAFSFPSENEKIRFGIITDSHYADREPANNRYYREAISKMKEAIDVMNTEKIDFVIHLGDFKDQDDKQQKKDTLKYLKALEAEYAKFNGPKYHCIGNHDVDSITKQQFLENTVNTNIPNNKSYYSFELNGYHFVVLDANYNEDGSDQFYKIEGTDWQNPNIPEEEFLWLAKDLESTLLPTIIFNHHPLYEYFRGEYRFHINQYKQMQQLLEGSKKVVAVFQGHVHEEDHKELNGIHYITQLGMVDGSGLENNSFSIVTVDEKQIQIDGYKRASDEGFEL